MSKFEKKLLKDAPLQIIDGDRGVNYPKKNDFRKIGHCLFLNTGNVTKMGFSFIKTDFITKERDELLRKGKLQRGDLVLTTRGTVGNTAFFNHKVQYENIRINSGMVILRVNPEKLHPYYLYAFLKSDLFQNQVMQQGSGSAQPQLPISNLKNIVIPWKDISTQKQIAKVLSDLDAKIDLNNQINAELEAMAKLIYDYWFVQFDFPDANGKPYKSSGGKMVYHEELKREIPAGWEVKKISSFAKTSSGGTPLRSKKEYYHNGNIPWINSGELNQPFIVSSQKFITKEGLNNSSAKIFKKGTILIAMYGATAGKVSFMDIEACTNQAICAIDTRSNLRIYLKLGLETLYNYLVNLSSGSARDNLSQDKIKELRFAIPNQELLQQFDDFTKAPLNNILSNLKQNQQLTSLRDWLLPMLMNGQVSVAEAKAMVNK